MPERYEPTGHEASRYAQWEAAGGFVPHPSPGRPPFSMILPPPNITGNLHMGHAYEHTISDAFARYQRMNGTEMLWAPGMDHAGIATQNIIERQLATEGLTRHDIGRTAFLERTWAWKETSGGQILDQMKRLGASPDWSHLTFTLDDGAQLAVRELFKRLFDDGLIYRAQRIIGWCERCTTALADIEIDTDDTGTETCSRCATIIERRNSTQWFLRTATLAAKARETLSSGDLTLEPASLHNDYFRWCDTMHDWCISRQLWWGHRIPIWYGPNGETESFAPDADIPDGWTQDDDILDTWFSSALWPLTCLGWPAATADMSKFYPTTFMCTGTDLLFFWALRMIMICTYATGTPPFKTLYLHGMIRDSNGKKMSKSFGNTIDPLDMIDAVGADPLRLALARHARPGADIPFGDDDLRAGQATAKKLWSITRFTTGYPYTEPEKDDADPSLLTRWLLSRLARTTSLTTEAFERYDLAGATTTLCDFLHDDISDFYIEAIRPTLKAGGPQADAAIRTLRTTLLELLTLLHPIIPFITEELSGHLGCDPIADTTSWPTRDEHDCDLRAEAQIADLRAAIFAARSFKADIGLEQAMTMTAGITAPGCERELAALARLNPAPPSFSAATTLRFGSITLGLPGVSNLDAATRERLSRRLTTAQASTTAARTRLADPNFLDKAPQHIITQTQTALTAAADLCERLMRLLST